LPNEKKHIFTQKKSEHDKANLANHSLQVFFLFPNSLLFSMILSGILKVYLNVVRTVPIWHITSGGLAAGGGLTAGVAGHKRSFSHYLFCGATPPLAPNRSLYAGLFNLQYSSNLFE
jgi:hypothetical protein